MSENDKKTDYGFVKSTADYPNSEPPKAKNGLFKTIGVPFISGVLGASLVLGLGFYVPSMRDVDDESKESAEKIFTSQGATTKAVDIEVDFSVSDNFSRFSAATSARTSTATGSGVIISKEGYILTNNHVIDSSSSSTRQYTVSEANKVLVYLYGEDEAVEAKIIGSDSITDLAVLKIEKDGLTPIEFGDSDSVQVGEFAMAVGSPLDMRDTVTAGIISGTDREIEDENSGTIYTLIQTDAAINAGNSGGALVNAEGKLIGINTLKLYGTGIEGMGFAIPVNSTFDISEQLIKTGKVKRPYIGISGEDITEIYSAYYRLPVGVYVRKIQNDGPAKNSDLQVGDIIVKFNGEKIESMSQLNNLKNKCAIGDTVTLTVSRNNEEVEIDVTLTETP